jgi:Domain of unknown function (DUF4365)
VLAAAAGLQCTSLKPDCTGVDFFISSTRELGGDFGCVNVQVKSWSVPKESAGSWRYNGLTEKRFNALAGGARRVPRYLFLVVVPPDVGSYACADDKVLQLSHAAYWMSLADREKVADPSCERKVLVPVPQDHLLTVASLTALCEDPDRASRRVS